MSRKACCLCEQAVVAIQTVIASSDLRLEVIDVDDDLALAARYGADVPVLLMQGEVLMQHCIDVASLEQKLKVKEGEQQC